MNFTITSASSPKKNISFVLFLFGNGSLQTQPLFAFLSDGEKKYIREIQESFSSLKDKEVRVLFMPITGRKIIVVGMGKQADFSLLKAGLAMRIAVQACRRERLVEFAFFIKPMKAAETAREYGEMVASNAVMANFDFIFYKTPPSDGFSFLTTIQAIMPTIDRDVTAGLARGVIIGEEVNRCRELSNTPGGDLTPASFAERVVVMTKGFPIRTTVLDVKKMQALQMGGVLGVGKGSDVPPCFLILEYMAGPKKQKPFILVGKGVTFDTGGINLKPTDGVYEMHMDMSGGAAVIHTLLAAARLKIKKNIVVLVPAVENMLSGRSYRPGDLLRTMSGKTIEVLNTDAEGRVILADALEYAKRYNPSVVVDVATLTGAAIMALGLRYAGIFTPDRKLEEEFRAIGDGIGDPVWPLPLAKEYEEDIRGTFGDWANIGKKGAGAGASMGATFLRQFVKDAEGVDSYPWVHLDIAPRMTTVDGEYLAKGAAGASVRLLTRFLEA